MAKGNSRRERLRDNVNLRNAQSRESYKELKYGHEDANGFWLHNKDFKEVKDATTLLQKAGLNPNEWHATDVQPRYWEVPVKEEDGSGVKKGRIVKLYGITAKFKRKVPVHFTEAMKSLVEGNTIKMNKRAFKKDAASKDLMWLVGLVDHHFGKLAWEPETGSSYDNDIAEHLWDAAVDLQIQEMGGLKNQVSQILLPTGNDFFHFDTREGTTTAGTPQNCDGRWQRVYEVGQRAYCRAIDRLSKVAPVRVIWVPGNHDYISSYWLCKYAEQAFKNNKNVTFDIGADMIKYVQEGRCFHMFAHGDGPRFNDLKDMAAVEKPKLWAAGEACREVICGHVHQQKTTNYVGTWEQAGLVFRILPSLAATDFWHKTKGYTMSRHVTQSFMYSKQFGFKRSFQTGVDELCSLDLTK